MNYKVIRDDSLVFSMNKLLIENDLRSKKLSYSLIDELLKITKIKPDEPIPKSILPEAMIIKIKNLS